MSRFGLTTLSFSHSLKRRGQQAPYSNSLHGPPAPTSTITPYPGTSPLYLHPSSGLVSFLSQPPLTPHSATVLGRLENQDFHPNPSFIQLIHSVFSAAFLSDSHVLDLARARKGDGPDGYIHVFDQRQPLSANAHRGGPSADSIIFSFLTNAKQGLPVPKTYEPNPSYRVWTPNEGFMVLPKSLETKLVDGCAIARDIETEESLDQ